MIRMNRMTEYGLIAVRHMSRKAQGASGADALTSAREVADHYGLPFEITAKTLLRLKDAGLIQSSQGARGGYTLMRPLESVTLKEFLEMMEGPQTVVACTPEEEAPAPAKMSGCGCEYSGRCEIRGVMSDLNDRVSEFLGSIRLADLASSFLMSGGRSLPVSISSSIQRGQS